MSARANPPVRVALVPGVPALLPEYAGLVDPVADLRAACLHAVAWLGETGGFGVHGSLTALRLARHLATTVGAEIDLVLEHPAAMLVVANGSAMLSERAPGHLDDRAADFDADVRAALTGRPATLADLDGGLASELWADVEPLRWLGRELDLDLGTLHVDYDDAPFGVQYWVMRGQGWWR